MSALPPHLGPHEARALARSLRRPHRGRVVLDGSQLTSLSTAGAAALLAAQRRCAAAGGSLVVEKLSADCRAVLAALPTPADGQGPAEREPWLAALGGQVAGLGEAAATLGGLSRQLCRALLRWALGQARPPAGSTWQQMYRLGAQGLPVVALILLMVGATVAMQSARQLRDFGAQIYVADLLGISVLRELGPLITAVVMAGRSGAAIASELAAMVVGEEVDALTTMGIDPMAYLVLPRMAGLVVALPLLTMLGNVCALVGGMAVAQLGQDVPISTFIGRLESALQLQDLALGLGKSLVFAWTIVAWSVACGLRASPGAAGVGAAATQSVVGSIFGIVAADAVVGVLCGG